MRLCLIALNIALALGLGGRFTVLGVGLTALDFAGVAIACTMLALVVRRAHKNLRQLGETGAVAARSPQW